MLICIHDYHKIENWCYFEKRYICTEKKPLIFWYLTKSSQKIFKNKSVQQNTVRREDINIWHSWTKPRSPKHKSITPRNEVRGLSLQDCGAQNLKNALIDFKTNFVSKVFKASIFNKKKFQHIKVEKLMFSIFFRCWPEVRVDVQIYKERCSQKPSTIPENFKAISLIFFWQKNCKQAKHRILNFSRLEVAIK